MRITRSKMSTPLTQYLHLHGQVSVRRYLLSLVSPDSQSSYNERECGRLEIGINNLY